MKRSEIFLTVVTLLKRTVAHLFSYSFWYKLLIRRASVSLCRFRCRCAQQRHLCGPAGSAALSELALCRASVYRSRRVRRADIRVPCPCEARRLRPSGHRAATRTDSGRHSADHLEMKATGLLLVHTAPEPLMLPMRCIRSPAARIFSWTVCKRKTTVGCWSLILLAALYWTFFFFFSNAWCVRIYRHKVVSADVHSICCVHTVYVDVGFSPLQVLSACALHYCYNL